MALPDKEIVIDVTKAGSLDHLLEDAKAAGITKVISKDPSTKVPVSDGISVIRVSGEPGPETAAWVEITGSRDMDKAVAASKEGHAFVVVEPANWKVIPLENLIADFHRNGKRIYAYMHTRSEMEMAFSILEKGVDGIVAPAESLSVAAEILSKLRREERYSLPTAKITRVVDVGTGERACIDTASQLSLGEGLLVGSRASFFFLVHSETVPSEYIPTREFRVNAGAIHSYVLGEGEKTRYLAELKAADRVLMVDREGKSRQVVIGRVKIERRPLIMIEAEAGGEKGTVMLQNAETIRMVRPDGSPVSVTEIRPGDEILVHVTQNKARHFGGEVDEYILER